MTCTKMYMEMELLEGETLQGCRGYGYLWIYPCVDIRLRTCRGWIHGCVIPVIPVFELMTLLSVSELETQISWCYWGCSMLSSSFLFFLFLFLTKFTLALPLWKFSVIIETLMQCTEWSQFAVDYFRISLLWSKSTKLQLLKITSKHCSEAVCTLSLRVAGTITHVACSASTSKQGMVNTLTSRRLPAPQC